MKFRSDIVNSSLKLKKFVFYNSFSCTSSISYSPYFFSFKIIPKFQASSQFHFYPIRLSINSICINIWNNWPHKYKLDLYKSLFKLELAFLHISIFGTNFIFNGNYKKKKRNLCEYNSLFLYYFFILDLWEIYGFNFSGSYKFLFNYKLAQEI